MEIILRACYLFELVLLLSMKLFPSCIEAQKWTDRLLNIC